MSQWSEWQSKHLPLPFIQLSVSIDVVDSLTLHDVVFYIEDKDQSIYSTLLEKAKNKKHTR